MWVIETTDTFDTWYNSLGDPDRRGILLCAGNKTRNEKRFYEVMIPIADREFTAHLEKRKKE